MIEEPTTSVAARLADRLTQLAAVSKEGPGVTRPGFGDLERKAHEMVGAWALADGASVDTDAAGNTVMTYRPGEPYFLLGSHLDSVPCGGRYDGVTGVVAALEVAAAVAGDVELGIRVVAFTCEEGAAFGRPCLGAELASGQFELPLLDSLTNAEGQTIAQAAAQVGLSPRDCIPWLSAPAVAAYLELHIEQADVLANEGVAVGVVDTIAGTVRIRATCSGRAGHVGTTPMHMRADALAGAAELILAVEEAARRSRGGVATVGRVEIQPNIVTTIPSEVTSMIDVRHYTDPLSQELMVDDVRQACKEIATRRQVDVRLQPLSWREPVVLSAWPRQAVKRSCSDLHIPYRVMPSAAGHDAAIVALRAPTVMLFVPTPGGASHVPDEACRIEDVATGVEVLSLAVRRLDGEGRSAASAP